MSGLPLRKECTIMIKLITPMIALITVSWMTKARHVALFPYLALKAPFAITISMYYMIYQSNTYMDTRSQN